MRFYWFSVPVLMSIFLFCIALAGCGSGMIAELMELKTFRDSVATRYQVRNAALVLVNGNGIKLTITNSEYNNKPDSVKQIMAKDIGQILLAVYPGAAAIDYGTLILRKDESTFIYTKEASEMYDMQLQELRDRQASESSPDTVVVPYAAFVNVGKEAQQQDATDALGQVYAHIYYLGTTDVHWATYILSEEWTRTREGANPQRYRLVFLDAGKNIRAIYRMDTPEALPVALNGRLLEFAGNGSSYTAPVPETIPEKFCVKKGYCYPLEK